MLCPHLRLSHLLCVIGTCIFLCSVITFPAPSRSSAGQAELSTCPLHSGSLHLPRRNSVRLGPVSLPSLQAPPHTHTWLSRSVPVPSSGQPPQPPDFSCPGRWTARALQQEQGWPSRCEPAPPPGVLVGRGLVDQIPCAWLLIAPSSHPS